MCGKCVKMRNSITATKYSKMFKWNAIFPVNKTSGKIRMKIRILLVYCRVFFCRCVYSGCNVQYGRMFIYLFIILFNNY